MFETFEKKPNHIYVVSQDYDGSLTNRSGELVLETYIKSFPYKPDKVMLGTARQSLFNDANNAWPPPKTSCIPNFKKLCKGLEEKFGASVVFDHVLIADLYLQISGEPLACGASIDTFFGIFGDQAIVTAKDYLDKKEEWKELSHDDVRYHPKDKYLLLLAQMFKIAAENPTACINFEFFDDDLGILDSLRDFFEVQAPGCIPKNVSLKLSRCIDGRLQNENVDDIHNDDIPLEDKHFYFEIQGTAEIDMQWRETIIQIGTKNVARFPVEINKILRARQQEILEELRANVSISVGRHSATLFGISADAAASVDPVPIDISLQV